MAFNLNNYEKIKDKILGKGNNMVYEYKSKSNPSERIAVKEIICSGRDLDDNFDDALNEAMNLYKIDHPNVLKCHGCTKEIIGPDKIILHIAMEKMPSSLDQVL